MSASPTFPPERLGRFAPVFPTLARLAESAAGVEAFWVHGSRALGNFHDSSDLDVAYLVASPEAAKSLKGALAELVAYEPNFVEYFLDSTSEYWEYQGLELGVHIYETPRFEERTARVFHSLAEFELHQAFAQHVVVEAHPVYDPHGYVRAAQLAVRNFPDALRDELVELYLRRLRQKIIWWEKRPRWKSVFEELTDLHLIVNELARCHYALNKGFYMLGLKQYPDDLRWLLPDLNAEFEVITTVSPHDFRGERKRAVIRAAVEKLSDRYAAVRALTCTRGDRHHPSAAPRTTRRQG